MLNSQPSKSLVPFPEAVSSIITVEIQGGNQRSTSETTPASPGRSHTGGASSGKAISTPPPKEKERKNTQAFNQCYFVSISEKFAARVSRCVVGSSPSGTEQFGFPPNAPRLGNQRPWYV